MSVVTGIFNSLEIIAVCDNSEPFSDIIPFAVANKKVSVNTAIERPVIPQCNLPQTSIEFLSNSNDQVNDTRSLLNKEIIPIKYSDEEKTSIRLSKEKLALIYGLRFTLT